MRLLFLASWLLWTVEAEYLARPTQEWTYNLGSSARKGNAVRALSDGSVLATTSSGDLVVVRGPDDVVSFQPVKKEGAEKKCSSGVAVYRNALAVYPVVDTNASGASSTRLFGLNLDGSRRWLLDVPGEVIGTPVAGENAIYVVHNEGASGFVSVIQLDGVDNPQIVATLGAVSSLEEPLPRLAPASGRSVSRGGPGSGSVDLVAFGSSNPGPGALYLLAPSDEYEALQGVGDAAYEVRLISDYPRGSVAAPTLSEDGNSIFYGQLGGILNGWSNNRDISSVVEGSAEDLQPNWEVRMTQNGNTILRTYA